MRTWEAIVAMEANENDWLTIHKAVIVSLQAYGADPAKIKLCRCELRQWKSFWCWDCQWCAE